MEDRDEQLIRRALGRLPRPSPGPTLAEDVMGRVTRAERAATAARAAGARRWLVASTWLLTGTASLAALAQVEWSSGTRTLAWALALALVPLACSATLWPGRLLALLALCGGPGAPTGSPPGPRRSSSASPR